MKTEAQSIIHAVNCMGRTPLNYAARSGDLRVVKMLMKDARVEDINMTDFSMDNKTPLSLVENTVVVKYMMENGAVKEANMGAVKDTANMGL